MREPPVTSTDRRQTPRTKLVEIAYIGMGPENGGLVLDVSDGGLSFHAVAPVQPAETIHFLLSSRGQNRIEGAGEVVWTNEMRTVCGLRFTSLSGGAREHLTNWTNQSRMPSPASEKAVSPAPAAIPHMEESLASDAGPSGTFSESVFAIPPADEVYLSEPTGKSIWWGQLFLWIILGFSGAALLASAYLYGLHVGVSAGRSTARNAAVASTQPSRNANPSACSRTWIPLGSRRSDFCSKRGDSPSSQATRVPSSAPVGAPKSQYKSTSALQPPAAEVQSPALPEQHAQQGMEAGNSDLAAAMEYLGGPTGKRNSSKAARLLWSAVGNGNSDAEVVLADLYLHGNGVARSCEQGRVLPDCRRQKWRRAGQSKIRRVGYERVPVGPGHRLQP